MATRKLRISRDLNNQEQKNLVLEQIAGNSVSPTEGEVWYDTTGNVVKYQDDAGVETLLKSSDINATVQSQDDDLDAIAGLTSAANKIIRFTGSGTAGLLDFVDEDDMSSDSASSIPSQQSVKAYVDEQVLAATHNFDLKDAVRVAATANVDIANELENGDTLSSVTLATGDRVLLAAQTDASENGIYVVAASGAASRSTDADANSEVTSGLMVNVLAGDKAGSKYVLTTSGSITVDTTDLSFTQYHAGASYSAGDGIDLTGSTFSVDVSDFAGSGLEDDGSENLRIAAAAAGAGLAGGGGSALSVNVDDSSIEIDTDTLQIKAAGVTNAMLAGSIADSKLSQLTTANKVAGSAVQLASNGGLADSTGLQVQVDDSTVELNGSGQVIVKAAGIGFSQLASAAKPYVDTFVSGDFTSGVYELTQATHGLTAGKFSVIVEEDDGTNYISANADVLVYEVKASGNVKVEVTSGEEFGGRIKLIPNA